MSRDAVMEMEWMGIPIRYQRSRRRPAGPYWGKVAAHGRHCYYSLTRHHLHRETPWSTPWHSGKVGSMRPFLRETREGDIDLEAKQLMYGS
jgi:hypothetical protein